MGRNQVARLTLWICAVFLALAAIAMTASTVHSVVRLDVPGPVGDFWSFLPEVEAFESGEGRIEDLLVPHHGHRLFFPKLLYLADHRLFAGRNSFLRATNIVLALASAVLLLAGLRRERGRQPGSTLAFLAAATAVSMFSGSQLENFVVPWNVHWFLANFACIASLSSIAWTERALGSRLNGRELLALVGCLAAAVTASYSMANGLGIWPALALVAWVRRLPTRWFVSIAITGGLILAHFAAAPGRGSGAVWKSATSPTELIGWQLACFGSPLSWNSETAGTLVGAVGVAGALAFMIYLIVRRPELRPIEGAYTGLMALTLTSGFLAALGRASMSSVSWEAPRYQAFVLLFWLGAMGMAILRLPRARPVLMLAIVGWTAAVILPAHLKQTRRMEELADAGRAANAAILAGVHDADAIRVVLPIGHCGAGGCIHMHRDFLASHRIGMFADGYAELVGQKIGEDLAVSHSACPGTVTVDHRVIDRRRIETIGVRLLVRAPAAPGPVVIADTKGRITGLGQRLTSGATGEISDPAAKNQDRWVAYSHPPSIGGRLVAWIQLDDQRFCHVAGPFAVWPGRLE